MLQRALIRWEAVLRQRDLRMNIRKMQVMKMAREEENLSMAIGGERLKETNVYKNLGAMVNSCGVMEEEIEERIMLF